MAEPPSFTRRYWDEVFHRTWAAWDDRQSLVVFALAVIGFLGYGAIAQDKTMVQVGGYLSIGYLAVQMLVLKPWEMWNDAKHEVASYRERLRPRISFVFDPDNIPYLQHFPHNDQTVRMYRVGIRNDSSAVIRHVRLVVESVAFLMDGVMCPPSTHHPIPVEHALNVMGINRPDGYVQLPPADERPTAYIDIAEQFSRNGVSAKHFSLCYATQLRAMLPVDIGPWVITLRAEGGGACARAKFITTQDDTGRIVLAPYGLL